MPTSSLCASATVLKAFYEHMYEYVCVYELGVCMSICVYEMKRGRKEKVEESERGKGDEGEGDC